MKKIILLLIFLFPIAVSAHLPVRENPNTDSSYVDSIRLADPTEQSLAAYGRINLPGEIDTYSFTVGEDDRIPVELLVPVRISNANFHPSIVIANENFPDLESEIISLPEGLGGVFVGAPEFAQRETFFEPFSQERLYHGNEQMIDVKSGENYFIYVFDQQKQTGDYSLGIGTVENFADQSMLNILGEVFSIKFGLLGDVQISWNEFLGLFIVMAGFIIGLGAVTVIDIHGFLGRKSSYWTQTTIRSHKVTKPLIWVGIILIILGGAILYSPIGWTGLLPLQALIVFILILNGLFLSFVVSPYLLNAEKKKQDNKLLPKSLQTKIAASFIVSVIGWWGLLFTLVWYLLVLR